MKKMRNSWLELYRVLAMLLIVGNHFATQGVLPQVTVNSMPLANYVVTQLFGCGGKLGVDMFVLLTGYFLADAQRSWSSLLRLWGTTVFWGVALLVPFVPADRAAGFGLGDALTPMAHVAGCGYVLYAVGVICGLFSACAALEYVRVCCAKWLMFWYNARIGVRCGH